MKTSKSEKLKEKVTVALRKYSKTFCFTNYLTANSDGGEFEKTIFGICIREIELKT